MTKKELIYSMALESGLPSADTAKALEAFIKVVEKTLRKGESVSVMGFGSFFVSDSTTIKKKNIKYPNMMMTKEKIPRFKVSPKLKDAIKKEPGKKMSIKIK